MFMKIFPAVIILFSILQVQVKQIQLHGLVTGFLHCMMLMKSKSLILSS